jgi:hypothetical protein
MGKRSRKGKKQVPKSTYWGTGMTALYVLLDLTGKNTALTVVVLSAVIAIAFIKAALQSAWIVSAATNATRICRSVLLGALIGGGAIALAAWTWPTPDPLDRARIEITDVKFVGYNEKEKELQWAALYANRGRIKAYGLVEEQFHHFTPKKLPSEEERRFFAELRQKAISMPLGSKTDQIMPTPSGQHASQFNITVKNVTEEKLEALRNQKLVLYVMVVARYADDYGIGETGVCGWFAKSPYVRNHCDENNYEHWERRVRLFPW